MKILYVITIPEKGGAQVHLLDILNHFKKDNELLLVTGSEGYLTDQLREMKVEYQIEPTLVRPINPLSDIKALSSLKGLVDSFSPDLLHCHSSKAGILGRLAAKSRNLPCVFTVHGWSFAEGMSRKRIFAARSLERMIASRCKRDLLITVAESDRQYGIAQGTAEADRTFTIHNGISDVNERATLQGDALVKGVMVARFSSQKDHRTLIEAVAKMNGQIKIDLVGEGKSMDSEQAYADSLGAGEKFDFLGNRHDVAQILADSDFFVLTTNWEGFPISILEAMRSGLPIIASDVGGVREAVHDGVNGFLIPQSDVNATLEKIDLLVGDETLRQKMGQASREIFEENFLLDGMLKKTEAVYQKAISQYS